MELMLKASCRSVLRRVPHCRLHRSIQPVEEAGAVGPGEGPGAAAGRQGVGGAQIRHQIATEAFTDASAAVARLEEIYERNTGFLRERFEAFANGEALATRVRATYPFVRVTISTHARLDSRLSYGFVARPGVHETSVTRPDLFRGYLTEQIGLLIENHGVPVEIGESSEPIPVHFAYRRDINIEAVLAGGARRSTSRCATSSTRPTSPPWTTRSPTARCNCRRARPSRWRCSAPRASTIRCTGSTTTPAPTRSTSRTS
jgi:hypothetical protein